MKMLDFKPPLDTPFLLWWAKINLPLHMKFNLKGTTVKIKDGALANFAKVRGKHTMICPNHSNRHDPQVMFTVGARAGEYFNFVAAREVFDYDHGINGWWLQHLGCYSVVRGAADRESFKTTRKILSEGKKKLVLFPEGEISRQNDTLMPLESGAAQMSFWAMSDIEKNMSKIASTAGNTKPESIYILPVAFKYTYPRDITSELRGMLKSLELKLGLKVEEEEKFSVRVKRLAETLLVALEKEYGVIPKAEASMNIRVKDLRRQILKNLAGALNVTLDANARELECVRVLRNKIDDFIYADEAKMSTYEKEVHAEKEKTYRSYYKSLNRVVNFISIYDGYVTERATQERVAEVIDRLESEIMDGEPTIKGPREVLVDIGEPIDLGEYYEEYKTHKKEACAKVTDKLFAEIGAMLTQLENSRKPRYLD
ncbi:MAG: 1-acyl-sn-glycerol-3-phosphate acyltransferase [Candidatus Obscuribacter sp.]|nr:1-acyl-sn-glycerol-3-phosphate acyltransferase [Candidatus Obscuribacter sp.]